MLAKRLMDLAILVSAHVLLGPLWLLLWSAVPFAIWLEDRGPIFYRQRRLGLNGRPFNLLRLGLGSQERTDLTQSVRAVRG